MALAEQQELIGLVIGASFAGAFASAVLVELALEAVHWFTSRHDDRGAL